MSLKSNRARADARKAPHTLQWRAHKCRKGLIKPPACKILPNAACLPRKKHRQAQFYCSCSSLQSEYWVLIIVPKSILEEGSCQRKGFLQRSLFLWKISLELWISSKIFCSCILYHPLLAGLVACEPEIMALVLTSLSQRIQAWCGFDSRHPQ